MNLRLHNGGLGYGIKWPRDIVTKFGSEQRKAMPSYQPQTNPDPVSLCANIVFQIFKTGLSRESEGIQCVSLIRHTDLKGHPGAYVQLLMPIAN